MDRTIEKRSTCFSRLFIWYFQRTYHALFVSFNLADNSKVIQFLDNAKECLVFFRGSFINQSLRDVKA